MKQTKDILTVVLTGATIFGFALAGLLRKPVDYSMEERRTLAQMPKLESEALKSGRFMDDFESYSLDQFPLRNMFRTMKAITVNHVMLQKDNNELYLSKGYISKLEYPMNEPRIDIGLQKLQTVHDKFMAGKNCNLYLSIIPDKNYFLAPEGGYVAMDYPAFFEKMQAGMPYATYIDIVDTLSLDSFYHTDQHWRQEAILPTAERLAQGMQTPFSMNFTEKQVDNPFYGTYYWQAAMPFQPDTITYLTNDVLDACKVTSYNTGSPKKAAMYDMEKAKGKDPYEMYLGGADPMIIIENPNASTDKELVIFRDSFGSSMVPLLAEGYKKITMVDMRYMQAEMIGAFVKFDSQDVLFLYSTLVLNNTISQ